jgi:hypothetical protein
MAQRLLAQFEPRLAAAKTAYPQLLLSTDVTRTLQALQQAAGGSPLPAELNLPEADLARRLALGLHRAVPSAVDAHESESEGGPDVLGITWLICVGLGALSGVWIVYLLWEAADNTVWKWSAAGQILGGGGLLGALLGGIAGFPIAVVASLLARVALRSRAR